MLSIETLEKSWEYVNMVQSRNWIIIKRAHNGANHLQIEFSFFVIFLLFHIKKKYDRKEGKSWATLDDNKFSYLSTCYDANPLLHLQYTKDGSFFGSHGTRRWFFSSLQFVKCVMRNTNFEVAPVFQSLQNEKKLREWKKDIKERYYLGWWNKLRIWWKKEHSVKCSSNILWLLNRLFMNRLSTNCHIFSLYAFLRSLFSRPSIFVKRNEKKIC